MPVTAVTRTEDIPPGKMKGFSIAGKQILVANVGWTFYAMNAICSHMGGYLPDGTLEGNIVTCPRHHSRFDITTGKFLFSKSNLMDLETYAIIIDGDEIKVRV